VIKFDTNNNGTLTEWMRITSAGNVGIGTQTPAAALDVASAATSGDLLRIAGPAGGLVVQSNPFSPNIVAGFSGNTVGTAFGATVSGGSACCVNSATGNLATVSGGGANTASGAGDAVSGGSHNTASGGAAAVSGGQNNTASNAFAAVGGGMQNTASGQLATVSGGMQNTASGQLATVSGGNGNTAQGTSSFAAGNQAQAMHDGTFVWGDNTAANFTSTAVNQFLIRAGGGVGIGTNTPSHQLEVVDAGSTGLRVQTNTTGGTVASFGGNGDFQIDAPGVIGGRFVVKEGGLVGIGISAPAAVLEVSGSQPAAQAGNGTDANRVLLIAGGQGGNTTGSTSQVAGIGGPVSILGGDGGDAPFGSLTGLGGTVTIAGGHAGGGAGAPGAPGNVILAPPGSGLVGIGTTTPGEMLDVAGNVRTISCYLVNSTVVSGTCLSDARLKTNIQPFSPVLDKLARLRPVHFDWRVADYPERHFDPSRSSGLIAQEVEQVLPELVSVDAQGFKRVNYTELPYLMLQAVKELKSENDALKEQNATLERSLQDQQTRLQAIELRLERTAAEKTAEVRARP
jgi:hypothetical protein